MYKQFGISALSVAAVLIVAPVSNAATVLTLEGGLVGMQHLLHFTPNQLRGDLCKSPNHCQPVDYFAAPGDAFNEQGAADVQAAIDALPDDEQIVLFGHSQGGQVIYSNLRQWATGAADAPDPTRLTWVSIGNPTNRYGGRRPLMNDGASLWLPEDTAYHGYEVIRQYDGWADWPDDTNNFLAVANAVIGMFANHTDYRSIDLNDPANLRYTPDLPDGSPGNVTYIWSPTAISPLAALTGPFAPIVDKLVRPIIESAYDRPVDFTSPAPSSVAPAASALTADKAITDSSDAPDSISESSAAEQTSPMQRTKAAKPAKPAPSASRSTASGKSTGHHARSARGAHTGGDSGTDSTE